jgi:hypothetical protein
MSNTYEAIAPDGNVYSKQSKRPITYGIAHLTIQEDREAWVINSFSYGSRETAEKRMRSLQKFYQGEWLVVEAKSASNG